jgi:diguanylate cyclase (GGDEF)-like protein/PAS domain S-box-containing protein
MSGKTTPLASTPPPKVSPAPIDLSGREPSPPGDDHRQLCQALLDTSPDAIFLIDHATMTFKDVNAAASRLFGYSREQLIASGPAILSVAPDAAQFESELKATGGGNASPRRIALCQHRSGSRFLVEQNARMVPSRGGPTIILRLRPRTAAGREQGEGTSAPEGTLPVAEQCDPLTGLPGREAFDRRLAEAFQQAQRDPSYSFAVFFVDLDGFKAVNDNLGHLTGDRILCEIAVRLAACVRPDDMVARRSGDEFTLLIDNLRDPDDAVRVAQRIRAEVVAHAERGRRRWSVTASIGIALNRQGYRQPDELIHDADMAMYRAKAMGKGHYVLHRVKPR